MSCAEGYEAEVSGARERKAIGRGCTLVIGLAVCWEDMVSIVWYVVKRSCRLLFVVCRRES